MAGRRGLLPGAQSAVGAGIVTIGNLQFVPPDERADRERQLRDVGVSAMVTSWSEIAPLRATSRLSP